MSQSPSPLFLRRALLLDAVATGATALLLLLGSELLAPVLNLPAALLRAAGGILVPFAALVLWSATRDRIPHGAAWIVILGNAGWVLASLALLASGWVSPSTLGYVFVVAQAAVVAIFAKLQFVGLRKAAA
jgi:hypothetical protein